MRLLKHLSIAFLIIIPFFNSHSQTPELDSLEQKLSTSNIQNIEKVDLLLEISLKSNRYDLEKTYVYSKNALEIADSLDYTNGQAESLRMIAEYYMRRSESDKDTALVLLNDALVRYQSVDNQRGIGKVYRSLGTCYFFMNKYPQSLEYSHLSLEILESLELQEEIANILTNIGSMHLIQHNYNQALKYYLRALPIFEELKDKFKLAVCTYNIADAYLTIENDEKALDYLSQSMELLRELNLITMIPSGLTSMGKIYTMQSDYKKALNFYMDSMEQCEAQGLLSTQCDNLIGLAEVYFRMGQLSQASKYGEEAVALAGKVNIAERRRLIYELMSKIYEGQGQYEKAYQYHVGFKTISDSLFNEKSVTKIAGLEYQYEFDKEKQALLLAQKEKDSIQQAAIHRGVIIRNVWIAGFVLVLIFGLVLYRNLKEKRAANRELKAINKSKDDIFAIISHDLKAPVGNIKSFLELIVSNPSQFDQKEIIKVLEKLGSQSALVFNILENLLIWAKSQRQGIVLDLENHPIHAVIVDNILLLQETAKAKQIEIENEVKEDLNIKFDQTLISTVIRNLLTNAIKFSRENGKILISAKTIENGVQISVLDQGVGMESDQLEHLFDNQSYNSSIGTHEEQGSGLGLKLCKDFIEMHDGTIWMESEKGEGSTCHFTLLEKS
ncbi:MAG: tetratricopeptide repeat-containing sensor histidine kinase [Reichenbachiella sp.]|uniref:ATP-binding protein n=1 Tax=Reichenbachiella sp. TaxID=2184521 RepID=UPI0032987CAB